jgi:hypothetical protein
MSDSPNAASLVNPSDWFEALTSFLAMLPDQSLRMDAGGYDALETLGLPAARADAAICGSRHRGDVVGEWGDDGVLTVRLADEVCPSQWMTPAVSAEKPTAILPTAVRVSSADVEVVLCRELLAHIGTHACVEHLGVRRPLRTGWKRALVGQRRRFPAALLPAAYPISDVPCPASEVVVPPAPARAFGGDKTATPAQVRYLMGLGYAGPKPAADLTVAEACDHIDQLKRARGRRAAG